MGKAARLLRKIPNGLTFSEAVSFSPELCLVPHSRLSSKMNRLLFLFAVGICFAVGQTLQCYKCDLGFFDLCVTTKITCGVGEHCFSGVGKAASFLDIKMKGCLASTSCNKTESVNFPASSNKTVYQMNKTCCNTDLCNGAPTLPGSSSLSLAAAIISALITARVLV